LQPVIQTQIEPAIVNLNSSTLWLISNPQNSISRWTNTIWGASCFQLLFCFFAKLK
jgi:hypothetical protein